jgi:hypothetical protein
VKDGNIRQFRRRILIENDDEIRLRILQEKQGIIAPSGNL